jgi:hypothetical protein
MQVNDGRWTFTFLNGVTRVMAGLALSILPVERDIDQTQLAARCFEAH